MLVSAKEIAQILSGSIVGDPDVQVSAPAKIEEAVEGNITFLANPKYEAYAYSTFASILLVHEDFKPSAPVRSTLIFVKDVYASLATLLDAFGGQNGMEREISGLAQVSDQASIEANVAIGAFSVISRGATVGEKSTIYPQVYIGENVQLGKNVTIYPGARLYHDTIVGDDSIIHSNCVIGSDGFGFSKNEDGEYHKIAQIGNVVIEENVEIGANTVVDRATMGSTVIKKGVKLDNLIQIAHNVEIGDHTIIAAQAGIAGSTKIGKKVMIGGQSGFVGHIKIADGVQVQAQSGVTRNVEEGNTRLYGSPALEYVQYLKSYAVFRQLPDLMKKLRELEKEVERLKKEKE